MSALLPMAGAIVWDGDSILHRPASGVALRRGLATASSEFLQDLDLVLSDDVARAMGRDPKSWSVETIRIGSTAAGKGSTCLRAFDGEVLTSGPSRTSEAYARIAYADWLARSGITLP